MSPRRPAGAWMLRPLIAAALISGIAWLGYELGRLHSGYSILDHRRDVAGFEQRTVQLEATIEELRREIAILETSRDIDRATYAQIEADLGRLQAELQTSEEELAFYRGIVSPEDGVAGLRIQNLEVRSTGFERQHVLRLMLVQAIIHSDPVAGTAEVRMSGAIGGERVEFGLGEIAGIGGTDVLAYDFRYFQNFEQQVVLPAGFEPDMVEVSIRPTSPPGEPVTQRFQWSIVSG